MKSIQALYGGLCKPAQFYLVISVFAFLLMAIQNLGSADKFSLGAFSTPHSNPAMILFFNVVYVLLWTWMLNIICKINPNISWVIVLLPFALFFLGVLMVLFRGK